jgi:hypothetical protein
MLLALKDGAVPVLEHLRKAVVIFLLETIELDYAGLGALYDLDLIALGGATPLRRGNVVMIEGEGIAAARRLPSKTGLGESALSTLLGEVQVDVIEALAAILMILLASCCCGNAYEGHQRIEQAQDL